ncbi:MAG TPA: FKBP-type peptidyl-prolyl cis-trans isomerase [Bacteroidales bacterium]|nr:FKBP-type peptidyl-prolyl cis-trans isomerase [Bacteroidales bacterium]HRZ48246.1 FKBP-type peptidyl-prolyl cis-trans isomerase [Bacteroidales bacterium]
MKKDQWVTTPSGMKVMLLQPAQGEKPIKGDKVSVHYTGRLTDSTVFDSSVDRGQPFEFLLGFGQVIRGWDEGIAMLHIGEKARLMIPPDLAYGATARQNIPANSTLIFDVELLDITQRGARPMPADGLDTITTPTGLKYIILKKGDGVKIVPGMKTKVHYSGFFTDGGKFDSSVDRGQPFELIVGKGQVIAGWDEGIARLHVGDVAKLLIPYQLGYGEMGRAPVIPPKANLIFDVEILEARETPKPKPFDVTGLDTLKTASGLKYIVVNHTENQQAAVGNTIKVHYTGYLESGEVFDSSVEREQPIEFELGKGMVIPGWEEGLLLLRQGEKARLIIPYQLAYGDAGRPPKIPSKANLIFDVEVVGIR